MNTFLSAANPLLARELRAALRNVRTFALLAVYVAILGAVVVSQFPSEQSVDIAPGGGRTGYALFTTFCGAQALLVMALLPALASGALSQERERQTLEPLLMTPMTPLQIVWGKAGGALALALILLLATLPLTSLCFLLGGVSPVELLVAYAGLLSLALFSIAIGIYCSAKWRNTLQATVACYILLPIALLILTIFIVPGGVLSGILLFGWALFGLASLWRRGEKWRLVKRIGLMWWVLFAIVTLPVFGFTLKTLTANASAFGPLIIGLGFLVPYMIFAAQMSLQQAAREVALNPEPHEPLRERVQEFKSEWQRAVAAPSGPMVVRTSGSTTLYDPLVAPVAPAPAPRKAAAATYGVQPFLSDKLNPIFAKDLRAGLVGKGDYFFRFGYVVTIATEILILLWMLADPGTAFTDAQVPEAFTGWGRFHLAILMLAGAWLGARAIAPEREGQTLSQLLTLPLPASDIIKGKLMAVMAHTFYVFILGVPLAVLLGMFGFVPWGAVGKFLLLEATFATFGAAWGVFCSLQFTTVRRALGWALGGVLFLLIVGPMLQTALEGPLAPYLNSQNAWRAVNAHWPLEAMRNALMAPGNRFFVAPSSRYGSPPTAPVWSWLLPLGTYALLTLALLASTVRAFRKYTQTA